MLRIRVFGALEVEVDGHAVVLPPGRRVRSLLAWLAVHPGPHPRTRLAALLWAEAPEANARASLRSAVWAVRGALGESAAAYLRTDRATVELGGDELWVDALEFDHLAASGKLDDALALCRGPLLAQDDDEWILPVRDAYDGRLAGVLAALVRDAEAVADLPLAIDWARRRAALRPLDEAAGRDVIRLLGASGDVSGALNAYTALRRTLRTELDVEPSADTIALVHRLRPAARPPVTGPVPGAPAAANTGLIGRDRELRRLLDCWHHARDGSGGAVLISGDGGIGKTCLAEELLGAAGRDGARTAACAPGALSGAPFELWSELLAEALAEGDRLPRDAPWVGDLARLLPAVAAHLPAGPPARAWSGAPDHDRIRLFEAVAELLGVLVTRRPLVFLLEDLHAADTSSLELTGYVGRRLARLPALLVLTRRHLPPRPPVDGVLGALRARGTLRLDLSLAPLAPGAVRRLVRQVAPLSGDQVERIVTLADGNPLLAVEAARHLAHGDGDPDDGLRTATRATLGRLSGAARLFTELVAAAGRDLTHAEVAMMPLLADPDRAATEALGCGLLRDRDGAVGFRHDLLRTAVYGDIADPMRVRLHDALATGLFRRRDGAGSVRRSAELARHLRLAGNHDHAAACLVRAASAARSVAALAEAAGFLREAVELDPHDPEPLVELAEVAAWQGRADESDSTFERALVLIPPADTAALVTAWLRRGRWLRGGICHPRESRRSYRAALDVLDRDPHADPLTRAEAIAGLAWAESVAGDPAAVVDLLREVDGIVGGGPVSDLLAHDIGVARGHALLRAGNFSDSYGPLIAAGAAAGRAGRPDMAYSCLINAASAAACAGDWARALDFADRCLPLVVPNGLLRLVVYAHTGRAAILRRLGRYPEAATVIALAADAADRLGIVALDGLVHAERGLLALATGDPATAADELRQALDADAPVGRPLTRLQRAEALATARRPAEAEAEVRAAALEPVAASDFPDTLVARMQRVQGLIAWYGGDRPLAITRLRQSAASWQRRVVAATAGDRYAANIVDLGRPPLSAVIEPDRELATVLAELSEMDSGEREE